MNLIINRLEKKDFNNYLQLIKQFRPIDDNISYQLFCNTYDKIFISSEIYVARFNDNIIGSITVIYEQKLINNFAIYAHIEDIIVDEKYRNLKVGSKLIDFVKRKAVERKCFKCTLVCNQNVKKFYLKNNFEERGINMSYLIKK